MADVFVEDILYLGDTRSADDVAVFTKMAPERLCSGCGLRVDEPFAPIATGERKKLFYAAQKLLISGVFRAGKTLSAALVTRTYPILSSLLCPTPPRHEYILNGTWRSHRNLPCGLSLQVYTQYPRPEVFTMTSSFSCMRPPL